MPSAATALSARVRITASEKPVLLQSGLAAVDQQQRRLWDVLRPPERLQEGLQHHRAAAAAGARHCCMIQHALLCSGGQLLTAMTGCTAAEALLGCLPALFWDLRLQRHRSAATESMQHCIFQQVLRLAAWPCQLSGQGVVQQSRFASCLPAGMEASATTSRVLTASFASLSCANRSGMTTQQSRAGGWHSVLEPFSPTPAGRICDL